MFIIVMLNVTLKVLLRKDHMEVSYSFDVNEF